MNNQIKMFIAGEEVVSQNEFTINEEMLSASSTILNNCYPKSWELDKDYVSRFYYPKDYSKFILTKGNFSNGDNQFSILTKSGNGIINFDTNVQKELNNIEIFGNVEQNSIPTPTTPVNITNVGIYDDGKYNITIEISSLTNNNVKTYKLNEPLRAIGEYKDRLYIENGILYVERKCRYGSAKCTKGF